jgi:hypothetical protein
MVVERYYEPTPAGGLSWDIIYLNNNRHPCDKTNATNCVIHEYGGRGEILVTHYGIIE